jgi:hypothetical protein
MSFSNNVCSLWIGNLLTDLEKLCINSFLHHGYKFNLYSYENILNIPTGTNLIDANKIIDKSNVFSYKTEIGKGSFSAFSNLFRYKVLYELGGVWTDMDVVCLSRFDDIKEIAIASEKKFDGSQKPTSCFLKFPAKSDFLEFCINECVGKNLEILKWGEIGPDLVEKSVKRFSLDNFVLDHSFACPIQHWNSQLFFEDFDFVFPKKTCLLHLWNEIWRRRGYQKNFKYKKNCLYEILKDKYLRKKIIML